MTFENFLIGILVLLGAIVVGILLYLLFIFVDSVGTVDKPTVAYVTDKTFTPAHTTTTWIMSGKVMVPITNFYPDSWSVDLKLSDGHTTDCGISYEDYNRLRDGNRVTAYVSKGRFSDNRYCSRITL